MNKREFLAQLRKGLSGLPKDEIDERLTFYSEMIDDRTEEGLSEEDAVREIGSVDEIITQIAADIPLSVLVKEKVKPKRKPGAWKTAFLVLGSPVWLSLLIAAVSVVLSFYLVLWAILLSLWCVFIAFAVCGIGGAAGGIFLSCSGSLITGIAVIGAGCVCAGLSVFLFFGCRAVTKGILFLTKKLTVGIKRLFIGKEKAL